MSFETILFEIKDGIARLTLNRPDRLNSFNETLHTEVRAAFDQLRTDPTARVLVLTGAGRGFCAGQDLSDRAMAGGDAPPDLGATVERNWKPLILALQGLPVPTICAVNGVAAGAGVSVALACDLVIAAESASFLQAFSKIGLIPDSGGTWQLPKRVGLARALGLAMLAEKVPARQAADWGLIWSCVPDTELAATVDKIATQFANAPTKALVRTREAMRAAHVNDLETQLNLERDMMAELGRSDDYREGVAAFMEKRAPKFTGK